MKLAFYYHIPIAIKNNDLYLPGYLGVFVDELAKNVDHLYLVLHKANIKEAEESDYKLEEINISLISLGFKTSSIHRSLFHKKILKEAFKSLKLCDALLVRSPSPLSPYFYNYFDNKKIFFLVVGDYLEGAKQIGTKGWKNKLLFLYFFLNDKKLKKQFSKSKVFVNSPELFNKYQEISKWIKLVKTSTLRETDFYENKNVKFNKPLRLLFTGRIEPTKGLKELVLAGKQLIDMGIIIHIDIVGWESNDEKLFEKQLTSIAKSINISENITFHGKKKMGEELNFFYRNSDIYVFPSHHEGFPRTIWEAMANKLPVVTTNVGGIPFYLKNKESALIVNPKNVKLLVNAIVYYIENQEFRAKIIKNAFKLAKENSLSYHTKSLTNDIQNNLS